MRFNFTFVDDRRFGCMSGRFDGLQVWFGALPLWNTRLTECAWFMRAINARVPWAAEKARSIYREIVESLADHVKWSVSLAGVVTSGQPTSGTQPSLGFDQAERAYLIAS